MYKEIIRPILFRLDPEKVHHITFRLIRLISKLGLSTFIRSRFRLNDTRLRRDLFGLTFNNPVGLAAGFDKDAELYNELADFGFGFVEIGTVTPKPQQGNPRKRLFRLKEDQAIINRMGFNNKGVHAAADQLKRKHKVVIGGNIGKNKDTANEGAIADYLICLEALFPHVDYFAVNVSSPNTPGLRELQDKEPLLALLKSLKAENQALASAIGEGEKPILLKIAPDLSNDQLLDIIGIVKESGIAGIIATNTTTGREALRSPGELQNERGGLSGKPLACRSTEVIRFLHDHSGGQIPIIGVGGIHSPEDALDKLQAGASLVQIWTGFVYEGPGLVKKICEALLEPGAKSI
jgi:dihydroorotate dehydrogenase